MKKILNLILVCLMTASLTACGSTNTEDTTNKEETKKEEVKTKPEENENNSEVSIESIKNKVASASKISTYFDAYSIATKDNQTDYVKMFNELEFNINEKIAEGNLTRGYGNTEFDFYDEITSKVTFFSNKMAEPEKIAMMSFPFNAFPADLVELLNPSKEATFEKLDDDSYKISYLKNSTYYVSNGTVDEPHPVDFTVTIIADKNSNLTSIELINVNSPDSYYKLTDFKYE